MQSTRQQLVLTGNVPTGRGVRVAVLDTGVDDSHPDLRGRVDSKSRVLTVDGTLADRNGHGTHVASIIGGSGAASNGRLRGIAPECDLVVYKIANARQGPEWNAIKAIEYAIEDGIDILNYSHGFYPDLDPPWVWPAKLNLLEEAFEQAASHGILCVVAAGNQGPKDGSITRPGGLESVLTVGAIDRHGKVLQNSSRGPFRRSPELRRNAPTRYDLEHRRSAVVVRKPDIVLPGDIVAARAERCFLDESDTDGEAEDPDYVQLSGSSQATAVASGMAALLIEVARSRSIDLTPHSSRTLRRLMVCAATDLSGYTASDVGAGTVIWPNLGATLEDFAADAETRRTVLGDGPQLI